MSMSLMSLHFSVHFESKRFGISKTFLLLENFSSTPVLPNKRPGLEVPFGDFVFSKKLPGDFLPLGGLCTFSM